MNVFDLYHNIHHHDTIPTALDLEMQQVMITVSGWDGVVVMDIVI